MNGILLVKKPTGYTSRDIVNIVGKILHTKKIGHTGTLDPLAEGVMVLCIGTATKLVELLTSEFKEYCATVILGMKTDTGDITGKVLEEASAQIPYELIQEACRQMTKTYQQTVPIYSAVKVNGKKLYEYARKNQDVVLPTKEVTVATLECGVPYYEKDKTIFEIQTKVSKGTYIRSLIEDIAQELKTIGTMRTLVRIQQGDYILEDCFSLEEIESGNYQLLGIESVITKYPTIIVDDFLKKRIQNGCILENRYQNSIILFRDINGNPLALYQVYKKDPNKIKPYKMLC